MLFVRVLRRLTLLGAALAGTAAFGQLDGLVKPGDTPDLRGDNSSFDEATKQAVITGHARLVYGAIVLTADEIRYSFTAREASAQGHLVITAGQRRLVADAGSFNTTTGVITAHNLRVGQFPYYITGETVQGTFDDL
ncbi:MAG: hypothetical protein ABUL61_05970, partial [Oleiharenicola lentus]